MNDGQTRVHLLGRNFDGAHDTRPLRVIESEGRADQSAPALHLVLGRVPRRTREAGGRVGETDQPARLQVSQQCPAGRALAVQVDGDVDAAIAPIDRHQLTGRLEPVDGRHQRDDRREHRRRGENYFVFGQRALEQLEGRQAGQEVAQPQRPEREGDRTAQRCTDSAASDTISLVDRPLRYGTVNTSPPQSDMIAASGNGIPE